MGITAISGPQVAYGVTVSASGATAEYNEQRGPSMADLGEALMDPRPGFCYNIGSGPTTPIRGWAGLFGGPVVDQIPTTLSTNAIAASTTPQGGNITLNTSGFSNGASSSVLTTISGFVPSTYTGLANPSTISVIGIDCAPGTAMGGLGFGTAGAVSIWDPTHAVARCLTINTTGTVPVLTIKGFDIYGYNLTTTYTSTFTANTGGTVTTGKAYKYIQSISASSAGGNALTIGVADQYGFPLRVDTPAYCTVWWGNSTGTSPNAYIVSLSSGAHVFGSTATATATTGDVRGTIAFSSVASNGTTVRLQMNISPSVQNLQSMSLSSLNNSSLGILWQSAGLVGVPQF